jgi:DNA-binding transcriptional MerR regulator
MAEYLKRHIAEILKKPARTIEFWTSSGLVVPEIQPSEGKGKARIYSGRNLTEFAMVELLARLDIPLDTIRHVLGALRVGKWIPPHKYCEDSRSSSLSHEEKIAALNKWTQENTLVEHEWFHLVDKIDDRFHLDDVLNAVISQIGGVQTVIWLGEIKKRAVRMILG